jgi:oxygen-independent coproporphyrinogen-3 oxidase
MMAALYLHIPFCVTKCHYCSFSSFAAEKELYGPYLAAMRKEISALAAKQEAAVLNTLFIGGGTPTVVPPQLLVDVLKHCRDVFPFGSDAEVSIEANPGTVNRACLAALLEAGVNRISFGVQSFNDTELQMLGRVHSGQVARTAVKDAKEIGFQNISLDLMYGIPGQNASTWENSLGEAMNLSLKHLSLYQLTIEPNTPFAERLNNRSMFLPSEDEVLEMDAVTEKICFDGGLHQYEISNYAVKGFECLHNINYWLNQDYMAAGASAVSFQDHVRERRVATPWEYIELTRRNQSVVVEEECLSPDASFRETVIMGLRMVHGVSRETLLKRYGFEVEDYYGVILVKLTQQGLIELTDTHLCITEKGRPFSNMIMADLV